MRKTLRCILLITTIIFCQQSVWTQEDSYVPSLRIKASQSVIKIDGHLDERDWNLAEVADDFQMTYPSDTSKALTKTEVRLTYDNKNLYIGAICYDEIPDRRYVAQSLKRDFSFPVNDAFAVFIDAFGDRNSGFSFSVSPYGVQRDGTIEQGGARGVSTAWNGLWDSKVRKGNGQWVVEMSIPFKTIGFDPQRNEWKINFARNDLKRNETSTWSPVPRNINVAMLGHTGNLIWDEAPERSKSRITLVPYVMGSLSRDLEDISQTAVKVSPNLGLDAKVKLSPSLNLEVTVNPDFSQVEVDQQVVNLDRFELSFPERRLFFLENRDLFSQLGNSRVRPFFSRRIGGVGTDPVPILGGIKLSGAINKKWRVGLLDVQTKQEDEVDDGQNYLVASASRKIVGDSSVKVITAFVTNRQAFDGFSIKSDDFNFTGGLDFNYRRGSKISGHSYINFATNQEKLNKSMAYGAKARYRTPKVNIFLGVDAVGENYITDMGFVPRLYHTDNSGEQVRIGYTQFRTNGNYWFYFKDKTKANGKKRKLDFMGPYFGFDLFTNSDLSYQEHISRLGWRVTLLNTSFFKVQYTESNPIVFYEFQLSGLDAPFGPGNYHQNYYELEYNSGPKNIFNGQIEIGYGDKFLGKQFSVEGELNYRPSKWGTFGVNFSQNELFDFPDVYGYGTITLLGAKTEFSFSKDLFWTTFLQYNTQADNFNVNTRFQWRYKPLSDIFLVVTNNSSTDPLANKNWSVALKINYWLDL